MAREKPMFSPEERVVLIDQIRRWFDENMDQDLGQFQAEFLLDFFTDKVGVCHYNQGLRDARALFESKVELVGESILELEKPTSFDR